MVDVKAVRDIFVKIDQYDSAKGMVYSDYNRAKNLLALFTKERADKEEALTEEDIKAIREIVKERWDELVYRSKDYTAFQAGHNAFWIGLAQKLAESGLIEANWYRFLMPTLKVSEKEPVTAQDWTEIPLTDVIVSEDKTELLSLSVALDNLSSNEVAMCVPSSRDPRVFTEKEKDFIQKHKEQTWLLLEGKTLPKDSAPRAITKETVLALKALAEGSASEEGFMSELDDKSEEVQQAKIAYNTFFKYLNRLTPEEKAALWGQSVISTTVSFSTFGEQFEGATDPKPTKMQVCATGFAKAIAILVMQYMPDVTFENKALSQQIRAEGWGPGLPTKTFATSYPFKEYDKDKKQVDYYKQSCLTLLVYIMSTPFEVAKVFGAAVGGKSIKFRQQENSTVSTSAFEMFNKIIGAIREAKEDSANENAIFKRAYFNIREYIVRPALQAESPTRSDATQVWLNSLLNETFWDKEVLQLSQEILAARLLFFLSSLDIEKYKLDKHLRDTVISLGLRGSLDYTDSVELAVIVNQLKHKFEDGDAKRMQGVLTGGENPFKQDEEAKRFLKEQALERYIYYLSYTESSASFLSFSNIGSNGKLYLALNTCLKEVLKTCPQEMSFFALKKRLNDAIEEKNIGITDIGKNKAKKYLSTQRLNDIPLSSKEERPHSETSNASLLAIGF